VEELLWVDKVVVVAVGPAQMFTSQLKAQVAGKHPRSVIEPRGVERLAIVSVLIEHGAAQLGIVAPRASIEVVTPDRGPDIVDHAHLGVYVDWQASAVF